MAAVKDREASSSSSLTSRFAYHVFLSFRGKEIRKNFIDHLYTALEQAGIHTYSDDDEMERGEEIELELKRAIEQSKVSIIVFTKDYASSRWCLAELVRIVDRMKNSGQIVFPVFYDVDPSHIRKQTGSIGEAISKHEEDFKAESDERKREREEEVNRWKEALTEVANLGGMVLQNEANGHESRFIQKIVRHIGNKINRTVLNVAPYPIGLDSRVNNINLWVQDCLDEVGVMAIYGMGGIGKTTIAKAVYNQNFDKFDGSSFLANIREASEQPNGLVRLQRQLVADILKKKANKVYNLDEGVLRIKTAVSCKRVLLVLDDVDQLDQLNAVLGMRDWFRPGSKIIITTRRERLLKAHDRCLMHRVEELNDRESLQLFSWHAFGQDHPIEGYTELSERVLKHCGGNPLALQVLGSSMSGRSVDIWESAMKKLEAIPDSQILKKLKVSYDSLEDDHDRNLFLDIVCFFVGKDKGYAIRILDECDFFTVVGIQNLTDRSLLNVGGDGKLNMHDLIRDMGRDIVRQESAEEPGKRSRLWHHKDSLYVLSSKTGTETIKGLVLDMRFFMDDYKSVGPIFSSEAQRQRYEETVDELLHMDLGRALKRRRVYFSKDSIDDEVLNEAESLRTETFARMDELRLLQLHYVKLGGSYKAFPKKLKWVYWLGFPLTWIPNDFPLESVVALEMRNSSLKQVWRGTKVLRSLRFLNLSHSHDLIKTPDFSGLPNLETLILKDCIRLGEVHESVEELEKLILLNLRDCRNLQKLPRNISKLKSLEKLILSGCSKLTELPLELGKLESLTVLDADKLTANQLVSTTGQVKSWRERLRSWLSRPGKCPKSVNFSLASLSRSLVKLSLAKCNLSNDAIPMNLTSLSSLEFLNLSENPICILPEGIKGLSMLKDLWLDSCTSLEFVPELPMSVVKLKAQNCTSLKRITNLPNLLNSLFLDVSDSGKLVEIQGLFKLEPIENFEAELMNNLGLLNLESIENTEVELFNKMTKSRIKCPVQGLYEFGIFSTSLPGNKVPDWYSYRDNATWVSFNVPSQPDPRLRGLNICFVYSRSRDRRFQFWGDSKSGNWFSYFIKISNETSGLKWVYSPTFLGIPGAGEDMTWLSHWKFGDYLHAGDEMSASVVGWSHTFRIKQFGISFVYEEQQEQDEKKGLAGITAEEEEEEVIKQNTASSSQNVIDNVFSAYQLRSGAYLLSHPEFFVLGEGSSHDPVRAVLYEHLFADTAKITEVGPHEEEREQEEEEGNDSDDFYDNYMEVDEEELMAILGCE